MKKKGQITVFIIIGLVILISAAIVIYVRQSREGGEREEVLVPSEIKPVYDYISACMYEASKEAVDLIGIQGGYVDIDRSDPETAQIARTPASYLPLDPGGLIKVPFWYYEGERRIPTNAFMQKQISDYVHENIDECLQGFEAFEDRFDITEQGSRVVAVSFSEADVVTRMNWPLSIAGPTGETYHDEFLSFVPVRLGILRDAAEDMMVAEDENVFFENLTLEFMAFNPDIPMDSMEMKCGAKTWKIEEIKERLQRMLRLNLQRVKVRGTDHIPFQKSDGYYENLAQNYGPIEFAEGKDLPKDLPTDAFEYARMYFDAGLEDADDLKVYFKYEPIWGMDLFAYPSTGGVLRSDSARGFQQFLSFICINVYHFTYDVRYPIMGMVNDPESYDGKGYTFNFAFPVLISENSPKRDVFRSKIFNDLFYDPTYCEKLGTNFVDIMVKGYDEEGYFMPSGMKEVNISFQCLNRYCTMGQTDFNPALPGRYILRTAIPSACANPFVIAEKEGYLPEKKQIASDSDFVSIELQKLRELELNVVKHPYITTTQEFLPAQALGPHDNVSFYLRSRNRSSFSQAITYPASKEIGLLDSTSGYTIDAFLTRRGKMTGGYSDYNLTITGGQLSGKTRMTLHVLEYRPLPTTEEKETEMLLHVMGGSSNSMLKPTFD